MPDQDCICIREQLSCHPDRKLGFVIYRLTYKDDAEWARFMDYVNRCTREGLEKSGDGDLFSHIDWSVQEDSKLQDADPDEVRTHFQRWLDHDSSERNPTIPRYMACLAVKQIHVNQVLEDLDSSDSNESESGFVKLVSVEVEEGYTNVGVSSIFPRVYSLLESPGWIVVDVGPADVYN